MHLRIPRECQYKGMGGGVMAYKYELRDTATMNSQELLTALLAREIAPRVIVGTGYINARQVAIDYLTEEIVKERGNNGSADDVR